MILALFNQLLFAASDNRTRSLIIAWTIQRMSLAYGKRSPLPVLLAVGSLGFHITRCFLVPRQPFAIFSVALTFFNGHVTTSKVSVFTS